MLTFNILSTTGDWGAPVKHDFTELQSNTSDDWIKNILHELRMLFQSCLFMLITVPCICWARSFSEKRNPFIEDSAHLNFSQEREREWGWWRGDREWMDLVFYCQLNTTHGHDTGPRSLVTEWSPPVTRLSLHTSLFYIPLLWEKLSSHKKLSVSLSIIW